ncbi:hypothetical protein HMPREF9370_0457 [Neisseria wadsworthii 9715]|uniref:Uncharacterized protein n=1 Tax=Neisseria wadsworthii 9715 TaxID=1030841 RepID=G4CMZ8_9NEIS|nr:hypothetical protein HMPREF9370_0457 [Neisseria wadsworthii 9715]
MAGAEGWGMRMPMVLPKDAMRLLRQNSVVLKLKIERPQISKINFKSLLLI